jgi:hypothetical protein
MRRVLPVSVLCAIALALPPWQDSYLDGTPDFLRLAARADQQAFRAWFTFLAEAQYHRDPRSLPREISDCSALLRYAYREALRPHSGVWRREQGVEIPPSTPDVAAWSYPHRLLGPALFRVRPGATKDAFAQFADARTLLRFNTHLVSRSLRAARPGDLLFFHQLTPDQPFHSMVFLGPSHFEAAPGPYLAYHTGAEANSPGEVRRPTLSELLRHPEPRWRPLDGNPNFLGVFRWNILRDPT